MREQESKYETYSFMEEATNVMFVEMSSMAGINKFLQKAVAYMVKEYRKIYKGPMECNAVVTSIDPYALSY